MKKRVRVIYLQSDFLFSGVYGIGAVADVATSLQAEVTADGS